MLKVFFTLGFVACATVAQATPQARGGILDLKSWDFARDGIVELAGEWRFARGVFEDPAAPGSASRARSLVAVPGDWNATGDAFGFGTYRLTIDCRSGAPLALITPIQHSAVRLYVNGRLTYAQGAPGKSAETTRAALAPRLASIEGATCPLQIVAHVANYEMRRGGLIRGIELGDAQQVLERREHGLARDMVTAGGMGVVSLLALLFWLWRREDRAPLCFALYGLIATFFAAAGGERILHPLMAPLGWDGAWRMYYLGFLAGPAAFAAFIRALYPATLPRRVLLAALAPLALMALFVLAAQARLFVQVTPAMLAVFAAIAAGSVFVLVRAGLRGRRDAWLMLVGVAGLIVAGIHDTLGFLGHPADKWTPYGLLVFVLAPAILLAGRFARALEAEEARAAGSEQRVDLLVRATQAGLLDWDSVANVTTYSERFKEMLGYPAGADTSKWDFFQFIHPEDREHVRNSFLAQLRDRSNPGSVRLSLDPMDYRLRRLDGSPLWIHAEAVSVVGADGRTLRYVCSFIDISGRMRQEEALRESNARYDTAMRAINEGVYDWDVRGDTIFYSDSVYRALGVPESMKTARDWRDRVHPEDQARYDAAIVAHFKGETERFECDYRYRRDDGSWRWARQHGIAIRDAQGRAVRMVGATGDVNELKQAELELRDQMDLTRTLIEENPNAMYLKDTEGRYVTVNDAWLKMVGVTREQAIGRNVLELFPERESEKYHAEDMRLLGQKGIGVSEVESLRTGPDGNPQWVIIRKAVLRRADGSIIGLIGANTDITNLKRYEAELAAERQRLVLVVSATQAGIIDWDLKAESAWFSDRFKEMLGYPAAHDASGWTSTFSALIHPDDRDRSREVFFAGLVRPGEANSALVQEPMELRLRRAGGSWLWVEMMGLTLRDEAGEATRHLAAVTDISARRAMQEALQRERERLQLLVRATKSGFMDWDAQTDERTFSERFKEMLGYPPDADTAKWPSLFDMMHPDDREPMREVFRDILRSGAATGERMHGPFEYRLRKADGSYLWVRVEGITQLGADGRTERFLASSIDITHLREMNRALEESVRLREEVDRISRHDLKTPISSIVGIPRLLRDSGRMTREDGELLAMVEQAGYRLLGMVNLSLDMFRMEQGTYPFSPGAVDLLEVLENIVRDLRPQADSLRVAMKVEGPRLHARAETLLCYSMLANLVKNALEASSGGVVKMSLEQNGDMVLVRVHNDGAVPDAVRERFFEKYSSAGKAGGTGLGTYSARLMARTQQGDIEMETSEAAGTTLAVRLHSAPAPVAKPDAAAEFAAAPAHAEPARPLAVLVVDDDEYTRLVVQRFLPASTSCRTATNGREALDAVMASPPDAVVMDLDMPVLGGIDAATRIREWERAAGRARCALIAMSSHDDKATRARCMEAGFDRYLEKPISPEALRRALAELVHAPLPGDPVAVDADLQGVLSGFLESRRELARELAAALEAGKAEQARKIAHKLAGSLSLYGFHWAARQGKMIEQRARAGALAGLAAEVRALREHLDKVQVQVVEATGEAR